ncbi:MAG: hypothetical protein JST92_23945, partial [Deltaproteobacteria bacterium]|nr:hypothetical protein [Deltaproteobacteria bacterium]
MTHKLLARQLKRSLGIKDEAALQELLSRVTELAQTPGVPPLLARVLPQVSGFLAMVSESYEMNDRDLVLRTRSLELSSRELVAANDKVRREAAEQQLVLDSLRQTANRLADQAGLPALALEGKNAQQTSNFVAQLVEERTQAQAAAHDREQEARRAQAQLASAIESLDAGFAMWGPDERLVTSNHRFEELHPYYQSQMVPGRTLREVLEGTLANMGGQPYDGSDGATWIERQMAAIRSAPREIVKQVGRRWIR